MAGNKSGLGVFSPRGNDSAHCRRQADFRVLTYVSLRLKPATQETSAPDRLDLSEAYGTVLIYEGRDKLTTFITLQL